MTGEELRAWRTARNITQAELARILGVREFTVHRWEVGDRNPPAGFIMDLALESVERHLNEVS